MEKQIFRENGSQYIQELISIALEKGEKTAMVSEDFEINTAIRIPSDFTLVLDGCHLKMADGCYSNMFVNEHHDTEIGRTVDGTDHNISIIGKNNPILDGGKYNGLCEKNHSKDGLPPIWKNNLLLFTNVDGFEVSGISCHNQRWWALNFVYCSNGKLSNIDFKACDIWIDDDGNEHHGLKRSNYCEILVKNADGIDLRQGCHNIVIENITGFTEDDTIALTALDGSIEKNFRVEELCPDIYNVTIKNVKSSAYCTIVRLLNQGDIKLHDILIDGVYDTSADSPYMDRGIYGVRVGDEHLYGKRHSTEDETYNITIKNVCSRADYAAVVLAGKMKNLVIENIKCMEDTVAIEDKRA